MKYRKGITVWVAVGVFLVSAVFIYQVVDTQFGSGGVESSHRTGPAPGVGRAPTLKTAPPAAENPVRPFYASGPSGTIALDAEEPQLGMRGKATGSLLLRELARQALLMAARDRLGVPTRDRVLREGTVGGSSVPGDTTASTAPSEASKAPDPTHSSGPVIESLDMRTTAVPGGSLQLQVTGKRAGGTYQVLLEEEVPLAAGPKGVIDYAGVTSELAALSRREFADLLKEVSPAVTARPPASAPTTGPARDGARPVPAGHGGALPEPVEKALGEMSLVSQFAALRQAHEAIRSGGESSELLGALVRGYANLGQLTQFQWTASRRSSPAHCSTPSAWCPPAAPRPHPSITAPTRVG